MYYVLESQITKDKKTQKNSSAVNVFTFDKKDDAMSKYHEILMYASKSELFKHGAIILSEDLIVIKSEVYAH